MIDLYKNRRSIRKFTNEPVSQEEKDKIIQAGLLAPSSMNKKPVELIVVDQREILDQLENCKNSGTAGLKTCPLAIVVTADASRSDVWVEDASIAATMMFIEVEKLGLGHVWIQLRNRTSGTEDSEEAVRKVLNIPGHMGVLCILCIGHKDEIKLPNENIDLEKAHHNAF